MDSKESHGKGASVRKRRESQGVKFGSSDAVASRTCVRTPNKRNEQSKLNR
jgi:hypothetical protein